MEPPGAVCGAGFDTDTVTAQDLSSRQTRRTRGGDLSWPPVGTFPGHQRGRLSHGHGHVLANQHKLPLWAALVAGIAGAVIGDSVGYEVGKRYGERILTKIPNRILKQEHLDRAKESVRRNGGKAVFVGRFTAALRVLVPAFSGMSRIPYGTSLAWNAAGGALWATAFVLLGFAAGGEYQRVAHNASLFGIALLLLIAVLIVVKKLRSRSKAPAGS